MLDAMLAQAQKETAEAKEKLEAITRDLEDKAVEIAMLKYQVGRKEILYQSAMEIGEQKRLRAEIAEKRFDILRLKTAVAFCPECKGIYLSHPGKESCPYCQIKKLTPIPTVAAVLMDSSRRYLIAQRRPDQWMGGKWCFAGGKVDPGETLGQALAREIREELGVEINIGILFHTQIIAFDHGTFLLHYFYCDLPDSQNPKTLEVSAIVAVNALDLPSYDLLPVDIDIAKRLAMEAQLREARRRIKEYTEMRSRRD